MADVSLLPVVFDDALLAADLARLTPSAVAAFTAERAAIERAGGIPRSRLRRCRQDGLLGLPGCAKVYLPEGSTDRWAFVLQLRQSADQQLVLLVIAYGARHPTGLTASVYQLAHRRLQG